MFYALDTGQGVWLCDNPRKTRWFLAGKYRGTSKQLGNGFGNLLLQAVEDFLSRHTDRYQLYTNIVMRENVHWYKRRGFTQTKEAVEDGFHRLYFQKMLSR